MKTQTKKLIIQTLLLIVFFGIILSSPELMYVSNHGIIYGGIFTFIIAFLLLTLFIFIPVTVLYFMRRRSDKTLGKIFRFTSYLTSLLLILIFLAISIASFLPSTNFLENNTVSVNVTSELYVAVALGNIYFILTYLILAVLMFVIARVNKSLDGEFSLIPKRDKSNNN